jgi:hypothetical protein
MTGDLLLPESTVNYTYYRTWHHPNGAGRVRKYFATMLVEPHTGLSGEAVKGLTTRAGRTGLRGGQGRAGVCGEA